jgi:FkbM family methyltransferase
MPVPEPLKKVIRNVLFRRGRRPYTLRGGALKGYRFMLDLHADTQVWRGIYEKDLQAWLQKCVKPGAVCLDIGGAEGFFTLQMAALAGANGRVITFEPSDRGVQISQNLKLNEDRGLAKVEILRAYAGRAEAPVEPNGPVPTIGVDHWLAEHGVGKIDVVKIDVDGGEIDVVQGMSQTLQKYHPHLTIEIHSPELLVGVMALIEPMGYKMKRVEPPPHEHRPIPFNPTLYSV